MSIQEVLDKVERKKLLTLNRQASIRLNKSFVDEIQYLELNLRFECVKRNWGFRVENGMLVIG